jgi:ribonucleoside-diphosphate reductase alpha chain
VTDAFMEAARSGGRHPLLDPHDGRLCGWEDAGSLLDLIAAEAWKTGDPGLLFLDHIERDNPTPALGRIEATNPCGEAPLLPYEACWLGGVNLAAHLDPTSGEISWPALRDTCRVAARLMDDAIEMSRFPLPEIDEATRRTRKLGIGVMGFADLLIRLGIRYGSELSEQLARRLMREIKGYLDESSQVLASERGVFPAFSQSVFAASGVERRNATVTANAPNSTIAAIAGCSSGVEPLFSICFEKRLANGDRLLQTCPDFERAAALRGFASDQLFAEIAAGGSIQDARAIPLDVKEVFVTAHDLAVDDHIRIQAAFQESSDLAVAKTVNLPRGATPQDVRRAFEMAHHAGCKGVTCFRDGCRESSFLETSSRGALACSGPECAIC